MFVYLVICSSYYLEEDNTDVVVGVFSSYDLALSCVDKYESFHEPFVKYWCYSEEVDKLKSFL